jgi:hypothetical protein
VQIGGGADRPNPYNLMEYARRAPARLADVRPVDNAIGDPALPATSACPPVRPSGHRGLLTYETTGKRPDLEELDRRVPADLTAPFVL